MAQIDTGLTSTPLPAGVRFLDDVAAAMLGRCSREVDAGDLSSIIVLVPALPIASELRLSMLRAVPHPVLLPRFDTLTAWVQASSPASAAEQLPESERLVLLHEALRKQGWFDETALWGIASEMAGLFDELSAAALVLPEDEAELALQLQRAYTARMSLPLAFEARVVHELWRALMSNGQADASAIYRFRLSALARMAAQGIVPMPHLLVLLDAAPEESLDAAERDFLRRYGESKSVSIFHPAPRSASATPLMSTLSAAWPDSSDVPLFERALALALQQPESPLLGRLRLVPASGREQEAQAVVSQVGEWLTAGLRRIVLIAQDRLTARRVRALLEREGVLVSDETGWKLSTSRAASAVDALIETAAGNSYYRDLLDLCKSPFIFSDCDGNDRKAAVFALESALRSDSVKAGLPRIRRCMQEADAAAPKDLALRLIDRIEAATTLLCARPATLVRWINRLLKALDVLGALDVLRGDAAGKVLLDLLEKRRIELASSDAQFSLSAWRDWLNREFESVNFRDGSIGSPIVLTPLNAVCLRRFEAAVLIGGDAQQLVPALKGEFFNQSVRHELGLRMYKDAERELQRDLELLLATVPRVSVTWQSVRDGEANLLSPELALLSTLHQLAWHDDLLRSPLPARSEAFPSSDTAPQTSVQATPVAPSSLIPGRVSVSGYASLVACPYRFFARHVLRLGEMDEVKEEMGKSDYGALVHLVLERFHERCPIISDLAEDHALSVLQGCVIEVFASALEENFLATGWRLRWEKRLSAYLQWQREIELQGWRWTQAEAKVSRVFSLESESVENSSIEFYGRIDRIDSRADGETGGQFALFDYKTQSAKAIRDRLNDDIQLPAYALLHGHAEQAAYVALDDERVVAVSSSEDAHVMDEAEAQGQRLRTVFGAMHHGARLPAQGVDSVCRWCEMSGLCRKGFVTGA